MLDTEDQTTEFSPEVCGALAVRARGVARKEIQTAKFLSPHSGPPVLVSTCDIKSTFLFQVDAFHLRFYNRPNSTPTTSSSTRFPWYSSVCHPVYLSTGVRCRPSRFSSVCALRFLRCFACSAVSTTLVRPSPSPDEKGPSRCGFSR